MTGLPRKSWTVAPAAIGLALLMVPATAAAAPQYLAGSPVGVQAPLPGLPEPADRPAVLLLAANISEHDLEEFAELGRSLIRKDPLAKELRRRQGKGAGQYGFEIGIGATDKDTLPGLGKDRVGEALSPAELQGFTVAVAYQLEHNRNRKLAGLGARIAAEDDELQEARTADRDVLYWLGFDVATAIFGDPAMGAQGNTATGTGSLGIRDALVSAAARRGFNDAVAFHLARTY